MLHPFVLLLLRLDPYRRQPGPALFYVLVRLFAPLQNPSFTLHSTFVPACLPAFHASTSPLQAPKERTSRVRLMYLLSNSDSDVESIYINEDDMSLSSQSTVSVSAQAEPKPVLRNPPPQATRGGVIQGTNEALLVSRRPSAPDSPNILIPYNYALQSGPRRTTGGSARSSTTPIHQPISCKSSNEVP